MLNFKKYGNIRGLAQAYKRDYQKNSPFPHIVLDNFVRPAILNEALSQFPDLQGLGGTKKFNDPRQVKLGSGRGDSQILVRSQEFFIG